VDVVYEPGLTWDYLLDLKGLYLHHLGGSICKDCEYKTQVQREEKELWLCLKFHPASPQSLRVHQVRDAALAACRRQGAVAVGFKERSHDLENVPDCTTVVESPLKITPQSGIK
jgi:hypothetical protein